jgi:hypothetical protein
LLILPAVTDSILKKPNPVIASASEAIQLWRKAGSLRRIRLRLKAGFGRTRVLFAMTEGYESAISPHVFRASLALWFGSL